ncbi:hypothetical protein BV20DRAFT_938607 [Pilatotrama ljubarskyi]|nr:hypothetical protein BV20DRAFT_938607 [Pilatotrama ljubarskyi]
MSSLPTLPVELWLQIFRWATLTSATSALYTTKYRPFDVIDIHGVDHEASLTKQTLVLVCKRWRAWVTPLLYEDLLITKEHLPFDDILRNGEDHARGEASPCAHMVRRVHLPYSSTTVTSPRPLEPVRLLALCSSVEVLVRTAYPLTPIAFEFDTECPPLPTLKRLDWWHNNEAARSGGINSLSHVLVEAPNVEYLSVGGEMWPNFLQAPSVHLPHLTTLRMRRVNAFFVLQICKWSLPALEHVVFDYAQSADIYWSFWETFGPQVRTVELGQSLKFYIRDFLSFVLAGCTRLEELNYYVHFTHVPQTDRPQESLTTIGLHAQSNSFFPVGSPEFWSHLTQHLGSFTKSMFPALRRLKLYGDWSAVIEDTGFTQLVKPLRDRGCAIEVA